MPRLFHCGHCTPVTGKGNRTVSFRHTWYHHFERLLGQRLSVKSSSDRSSHGFARTGIVIRTVGEIEAAISEGVTRVAWQSKQTSPPPTPAAPRQPGGHTFSPICIRGGRCHACVTSDMTLYGTADVLEQVLDSPSLALHIVHIIPHLFCHPPSTLTCVVAGATMPSCLVLSDW